LGSWATRLAFAIHANRLGRIRAVSVDRTTAVGPAVDLCIRQGHRSVATAVVAGIGNGCVFATTRRRTAIFAAVHADRGLAGIAISVRNLAAVEVEHLSARREPQQK
jgi:hypothetical protein